MVPLGRKTLFEDVPRLVVALLGVMFAVGLIAIQSGIFLGFVKSSGRAVDESKADIWVAAKENLHFELAFPIRYDNLEKARRVDGVERAEALLIKTSAWRGPEHKIDYIRVIGFDPQGTLWSPGPLAADILAKLSGTDTAVVDAGNLKSLDIAGVGGTGKIGTRDVSVVGLAHDTQPIISATFIYASLSNAKAFLAPPQPPLFLGLAINAPPPGGAALRPSDDISYVLVKAKPGTDIATLKQRLDDALPGTVAYTQAEMAARTHAYWQQRTSIGFILGLAAIVGLIVGMAVVGQILYTSIADHIKEYGTLRAMGAPDALFYSVVVEQAVLLALLGFVPGIIFSLWVAAWAHAHKDVLILITPASAALTLAVIVLMCVLAGVIAVQRALRVDPAMVFKA